ncbi:MAG: glycosyltransferase family 2 protein [Acidobacteria bacterium]|nr:glycosyltransferase family 2 protein [Acidobacteriota bacterium]
MFLSALLIILMGVLFLRLHLIVNTWLTLKALSKLHAGCQEPTAFPTPAMSVLIPARNEENNIGACLESIVHQEFPIGEIIVVDDGSTDRTTDIVKQLQQKAPTIKLLQIKDPPAGWIGKTHALYRGVQEAGGEYLLFVDADARLSPDCLSQAMSYALENRSDLTTMVPVVKCVSFWEKVILPFGIETVFFPIKRALGRDRDRATAFGWFLLFKRATYDKMGDMKE